MLYWEEIKSLIKRMALFERESRLIENCPTFSFPEKFVLEEDRRNRRLSERRLMPDKKRIKIGSGGANG